MIPTLTDLLAAGNRPSIGNGGGKSGSNSGETGGDGGSTGGDGGKNGDGSSGGNGGTNGGEGGGDRHFCIVLSSPFSGVSNV
eukprot:CAMPEP_0119339610 /NCGR_PEP_ID=MMETSP1333-20130426/98640_1 /TAXON_ID=418940 /ORGANISM="Scyphosphaera apsteinii, Strain RCC1455" /LENGTH=81 /DNA_ID=CAMNT_0007351169 /DNA_START=236 /DNA_END=477 /DNA_ORIENTATION=-